MEQGIEIAKMLIDAGADVNVTVTENLGKDPWGDAPIIWLRTPLICAAQYDKEDLVKMLIDAGANVNFADMEGNTALHQALYMDATKGDSIKALIEGGININAQNKQGETALVSFTRRKRLGTARILIDSGADVNIADINGKTALHWVVSSSLCAEELKRCIEFINVLINAGVNLDAQDIYGNTALFNAAETGNTEVIKALIRVGASVNTVNKEGKTALDISQDPAVQELLKNDLK